MLLRTLRERPVLIVFFAGLLAHVFLFGYPQEVVFDEVHFGKFVSGYLTGNYFFDIHPPLAKLLLAALAWFTGFSPTFPFDHIGQMYPDFGYLGLRLLPSLLGVIVPVLLYLICIELKVRKRIALLIGLAAVFENALLVETRFIFTDAFLYAAGLGSLLFLLRWKNGRREKDIFFSGFLAGFALSVKWTGLAFLGVAGLIYLIETAPSIRKLLKGAVYFIVVPAVLYVAVFAAHFAFLPKSGLGDAYHTPEFQRTLSGNRYANDAAMGRQNIADKFFEENAVMFRSNRQTLVHPYGSTWRQWPFMAKPIYYWSKDMGNATHARIYLVGNVVVWLAALLCIILAFLKFFGDIAKRKWKAFHTGEFVLVLAYAANFFPFILVNRVMFLYHYVPALLIAILSAGVAGEWMITRFNLSEKKVFIAGCVLLAAGFLIISPATYGIPMKTGYFKAMKWLLLE